MKPVNSIFYHILTAIPANWPDFGICSKKLISNQKKMKQGDGWNSNGAGADKPLHSLSGGNDRLVAENVLSSGVTEPM